MISTYNVEALQEVHLALSSLQYDHLQNKRFMFCTFDVAKVNRPYQKDGQKTLKEVEKARNSEYFTAIQKFDTK